MQKLKLQNTNRHELGERARTSRIWVGKRATAQSRSRELPLNMETGLVTNPKFGIHSQTRLHDRGKPLTFAAFTLLSHFRTEYDTFSDYAKDNNNSLGDNNMLAFDFLNHTQTKGKTMMLDKGLGMNAVTDLLQTSGDELDYAKFGFGTAATMDRDLVAAKIDLYAAAGVTPYPGGTLLEAALAQGKYAEFLVEARALGFLAVEVSDGSTQIGAQTRERVIDRAREAGFAVITEVGKKNPEADHELGVAERLHLIQTDLDSGASYVIMEAREAGKNIGFYDVNGTIIEDELDALASVGADKLIFEAPLKSQQAALILKFGPQVNLGNIAADEVTALTTLRRGLRGDTLGRV